MALTFARQRVDIRQLANYHNIKMRLALLVFCILFGIAYFVTLGLGIGSSFRDGILGGWLVALTIWLARVDALVRSIFSRLDKIDNWLDKIDALVRTTLKK